MKLILFRHGVAEEYNERGDDERGLTVGGLRRVKKAARGLRTLLKDGKNIYIYSSPLRRARQTADMLAMLLKANDLFLREEVAEGRFEELYHEWDRYSKKPVIVVVGHEPQLGKWLERLTGHRIDFSKSAAALVDVADITEVAVPQLKWYLTAEALDEICRSADKR